MAEWLSKPPECPFTVVGDSTDEALAFLACVFEGTAVAQLGAADWVIVLKSAGALSKTVNASTNFIAVVASGDAENESAGIHRRRHTIVVTRRSAIEGDPDVTLDILDDESFGLALTDMGFQTDRIERLKRESGRSIQYPAPPGEDACNQEAPVGRGRRCRKPPHTVDPCRYVEYRHRGFEAYRVRWSGNARGNGEDHRRTNGQRTRVRSGRLVYSAAWFRRSMRSTLSTRSSQVVILSACSFRVARVVLSETDPALDLPKRIDGPPVFIEKQESVDALRETLCETLVLLSVHGNSLFGETLRLDVEGAVNRVMRESCSTPLDSVNWQSQRHDLQVCGSSAECAF